jgi:predicted Zn-dependent protease
VWRPVVAACLLALASGCVTNPITGKQQLSLVGKGELLTLAKQAVPSQFASDYGVASDAQANAYVTQVGRRLVATLKPADVVYPDMPFSFQVVNAVYINAYAFPDGTIAITRGMLSGKA